MRPEDLTAAQRADIRDAFDDHRTFARECLSIRDRAGSVVPLELSPGQVKISNAIQRQQMAGKPVRLVVLKTRRSFFTAGVCSEIFRQVAFFPGRRATIIADRYRPAGLEAFDYLMQYQISYRPLTRHGARMKMPPLFKPTAPRSPVSEGSTLQMIWGDEQGSAVDVLSAEMGDVGRGGGRHWLLLDELAFWRAAGLTLTACLNMVPYLAETGVIAQSTANGIGGEFYDLVQLARDPANSSGWEFVFFGWLEHPPYRMAVEDPVAFQDSLDREERNLVAQHGATLEQLRWRRHTIQTECRGQVDQFHQEFPTTPEEAFLTSGRPVFNHADLARHPITEGLTGELELIEDPPAKRLIFTPKEHGALTVWRKPEPGHMYVCGADPSKGVDVSFAKRGEDPDYSVGFVADRDTGEQVALLRERIRPVRFSEYLAFLGRWYNWAYLTPESNDAGFIDALVRTGYPIEMIYSRQRDPTDRRPSRIDEIGFETTGLTREWLVSAAEDAIRTLSVTIKSAVVMAECRTFIIKATGKKEHQDGRHDDCVFAYALTEMGRRTAPRKPLADPSAPRRRLAVGEWGSKVNRRVEDDD